MSTFEEAITEVIGYLAMLWDTIILLGNFAGFLALVIGLVYWLTDYDPRSGKKLVVGALILLIVLNIIIANPPILVQIQR